MIENLIYAIGGGLLYHLIRDFAVERRLTAIEKRLKSEEMAEKSVKGVAARQEVDEEFNMAMLEAGNLLKSGKSVQEVIPMLLTKYPRGAKKAMKMFGI